MPELKFFDFDRHSRTREEMIISTDGRQVHVKRTQDCAPIIDAVKDARDLPKLKNMRYVGTVPLTLYVQWAQEAGVELGREDSDAKMREIVRRKFSTDEYRHLKVGGF